MGVLQQKKKKERLLIINEELKEFAVKKVILCLIWLKTLP